MAFTFVQSVAASSVNTATFSGPSTTGDLVKFALAVALTAPASTPTVTVTDNGGVNVYVQAGTPAEVLYGGAFDIYLFDFTCLNFTAPSGNLVITGTAGGTIAFYGGVGASEYGVPHGTTIDPGSYNTASSVATPGMPITTSLTASGELLVFCAFFTSTLGVPVAGWNLRGNSSLMAIVDNLNGPAAGSQSFNPISQSGSGAWEATITGFYTPVAPAGGGVGNSLIGPYNFWGGGFS